MYWNDGVVVSEHPISCLVDTLINANITDALLDDFDYDKYNNQGPTFKKFFIHFYHQGKNNYCNHIISKSGYSLLV